MENNKIKSTLKNVPQTMLIPLRARYLETKKTDGIISDPKSVEIFDRIECDFSGKKEVSRGSQMGVAIRTEILDELTTQFLSQHDDAVVVNLGCGLDTRFHRLDNGTVTWFDLDVSEAIDLRKNFFKETDRHKFISRSVLDFSWEKQVPKGSPTLFIAEGLLMYFSEFEVKSLLKTIEDNFPGAEMILEAMSPFIAKRTDRHPDVKKYNAPFKWGIKTGKEIDAWDTGANFITEYYFFDRHKNKQSPVFRFLALFPGFRKMMKIIHLRF
ncbi:MAG: class I SAM-dependent methyltransferase [Desulfobacteraceae bacterium]|jgi:O-methyltransferase involved in polyketide biosynthesis